MEASGQAVGSILDGRSSMMLAEHEPDGQYRSRGHRILRSESSKEIRLCQ